jgi:hypothetical protein
LDRLPRRDPVHKARSVVAGILQPRDAQTARETAKRDDAAGGDVAS